MGCPNYASSTFASNMHFDEKSGKNVGCLPSPQIMFDQANSIHLKNHQHSRFIRRVFDDNSGIFFLISQQNHMSEP